MLLVGDIHIENRFKDKLLNQLKDKILSSKEKNVIFLGDYVYHFSYDRRAIVELFELFVLLAKEGKKLWIMSGNHDRIAEKFVFEEAAIFAQLSGFEQIRFVFEPQVAQIEDKKVLFLPFNHKIWLNRSIDFLSPYASLHKELRESENQNEKISAKLNEWLAQNMKGVDYVFHHFYVAGTKFPGQQAKFGFKDIALAPWTLDQSFKMFSGHLHWAFGYKNYFCTWSVWAVSFSEINEIKHIWELVGGELTAIPMDIRTIIQTSTDQIAVKFLNEFYQSWQENFLDEWSVVFPSEIALDFKNIYLFLEGKDIDDVPSELFEKFWTVKLKKYKINVEIPQFSNVDFEKMKVSFSAWKEMLKDYLKQKYPSDWEKYISQLKELKIL